MSRELLIVPGSPRVAPKPRAPGLRLSENFFQRWFLIVVPIAIMAVIGVMMAQRVPSEYSASSTLSTSANPLVGQLEIRGATAGSRESPAGATARVMSERLRTDLFASNVAERAGLDDAVDNKRLYSQIRRRVRVGAVGASLVTIEVRWGDPQTSLRLVDALIAEYLSLLQSTVSADAQSAVDFYEDRRAEAEATEETASATYQAFLDELPVQPEGVDLPLADQLQLGRLNGRVVAAQELIDDADRAIEQALLSVVVAQSEAGRSIQILDPATSTFEPESNFTDKVVLFVVFVFLGGLVALTILLLSTHLDRSVRSAGDIEAAGGGVTVAAVPVIRSLRPRTGLRRVLAGVGQARRQVFGRLQRAT